MQQAEGVRGGEGAPSAHLPSSEDNDAFLDEMLEYRASRRPGGGWFNAMSDRERGGLETQMKTGVKVNPALRKFYGV